MCRHSKRGKKSAARREELRLSSDNDRPLIKEFRKRIVVQDFESGRETVYELHKGKQINMYKVFVDGEQKPQSGMSGVLEMIRKANPPVRSEML
jgi:hypothetical protein